MEFMPLCPLCGWVCCCHCQPPPLPRLHPLCRPGGCGCRQRWGAPAPPVSQIGSSAVPPVPAWVQRGLRSSHRGGRMAAAGVPPVAAGLRKGEGMLRLDFTYPRRHIGLHCLFFHLPISLTEAHVRYNLTSLSCTIQSRVSLMYDTIYEALSYTIRSRVSLMYDINLRATATTIPSVRGVQIPIYLVTSATDSLRQSIVLFKSLSIPTSDLKSEFLCQSSYIAQNLQAPLNPPRTPGISPTPSSPRITPIATVLVLLLST